MKNMILIGQVATLAKDIEYEAECTALEHLSPCPTPTTKSRANTYDEIQRVLSSEADAEIAAEAEALHNTQLKGSAATAARSYVARRQTVCATNVPVPVVAPAAFQESVSDTKVDEPFTASEQRKLSELLGAWEEPQAAQQREVRTPSQFLCPQNSRPAKYD